MIDFRDVDLKAVARKAMEKYRQRMELVEKFIERILQEAPSSSENILREMRKELTEQAEI